MTNEKVRVRFAPSPTGPLHIGGVRTALYNYLLAKKTGGAFILRIEDTDQKRYVEGAEDYIVKSLEWFGLHLDEGPGIGGDYGPYRQSERKDLYGKYVQQLVDAGEAYYAFDSPEELTKMREEKTAAGIHSPKYDATLRHEMKNSLSLSKEETAELISKGDNVVVRLKVDPGQTISFDDVVRGKVSFHSEELDDKVLMKADGLPTYHMANIVDDYLMKISHVIRGEEWLSSTAHHVLLYRAMGWEDSMPSFAHLPLILKPTGKGKLGKRDGAKFGFPVFPLTWNGEHESFEGFEDYGLLPDASINFLAFLGWNPGTEQEMFSLEDLIQSFSLDRINKSGARFDIEKAKWFNQQYLIAMDDQVLAEMIQPILKKAGIDQDDAYITKFCGLMKERVELLPEFLAQGHFFFAEPTEFDEKTLRKKYKLENEGHFEAITSLVENSDPYTGENIQNQIKAYIQDHELGFGAILPLLRVTVTGTMKGPDIFETMSLIGKEEVVKRLKKGLTFMTELKTA